MQDVRAIAARPHPVGSAANAEVRDYLVRRLQALGMNVSVQNTTSVLTFGTARAVHVENIIATRKGIASSKAVLLVAHYDSETKAPGAGDDGYAVAAILETLRALESHPPLKNDLFVLMTDGEEPGLFGARAFVDEYPISDSIGFGMNFEGRGNSGPSMMFETTPNNGWVIRQFNDAVKNKVAFSLMVDLYRLLPNSTDFTFLKERLGSGLNFAHIGGAEFYHGARDDPSHLDQCTLQHHGESMLASVLHFGNINLHTTQQPDVIYFPFLVPRFIVYPVSWNIPLATFVTLLFIVVLIDGTRKGQLRMRRIFIALAVFLARVILAGVVVFVLWMYLGPKNPEFELLYLQRIYHGSWYLGGFIAFALLFGVLYHRALAEKLGVHNLAIGALLLWLAACWGAALYLPDGSYLFEWPLLFALGGVVFSMREPNPLEPALSTTFVVALCAVPGLFLYSQLIDLVYQGMTLLVAGIIAVLVVFLLGAMQHLLAVIATRKRWLEPSILILVMGACIAAGVTSKGSSPKYSRPDSIVYACNKDSGSAEWITFENKTDRWTRQFFGAKKDTTPISWFFPAVSDRFLTSRAPVVSLPDPVVRVLEDTRTDTVRTLKLRIGSTQEVIEQSVVADSDDIVYEARVNGKPFVDIERYVPQIRRYVQRRTKPWLLDYFGQDCELELKIPRRLPLHLRVIQRFPGIPQQAMNGLSPRPDWTIPRPFYPTDLSIVAKKFSF